MNFLLPIYIWPIYRLLKPAGLGAAPGGRCWPWWGRGGPEREPARERAAAGGPARLAAQEGEYRPNIPLRDKFYTGILEGPRNIPDTLCNNGMKFLL